jgi:hypothetical protein
VSDLIYRIAVAGIVVATVALGAVLVWVAV